jgi:hypothetical protein
MPEDRQPPADAVYRAEYIKVLRTPDTFFGLLAAIRERPGIYIGQKSLRDLFAWLCGFRFARMMAKLPPLPDEGEFEEFDAFVCDEFRWHDVGGWAAKIAYYYRDDADAFDQFFVLLDKYRAGRRRTNTLHDQPGEGG